MSPSRHDQYLGPLFVEAGCLHEFVERKLSQFITGMHIGISQFCSEIPIHALEIQQVISRGLEFFFLGDRFGQQGIAGTLAQFVDRVFIEGLDFEHLVDRHVGHLVEAAESFVNQDVGEIIVADVNQARIAELLAPDRVALQKLIRKQD
jgi:hypothetical protein